MVFYDDSYSNKMGYDINCVNIGWVWLRQRAMGSKIKKVIQNGDRRQSKLHKINIIIVWCEIKRLSPHQQSTQTNCTSANLFLLF